MKLFFVFHDFNTEMFSGLFLEKVLNGACVALGCYADKQALDKYSTLLQRLPQKAYMYRNDAIKHPGLVCQKQFCGWGLFRQEGLVSL